MRSSSKKRHGRRIEVVSSAVQSFGFDLFRPVFQFMLSMIPTEFRRISEFIPESARSAAHECPRNLFHNGQFQTLDESSFRLQTDPRISAPYQFPVGTKRIIHQRMGSTRSRSRVYDVHDVNVQVSSDSSLSAVKPADLESCLRALPIEFRATFRAEAINDA